MRECVRVHQTKNGCLLSLCSLPFSIVLIHRCYSPTWPPSPHHRLLLKTQGRSTYFRPANQFPTQKRVQNRSNAKKDTRSLSGPSTLYFVRDQNNPKTRLSSSRAFERVMEKLAEKVVFPVCFLLWPVFFSYTPLVWNVSKLVLHGGAPTKSRSGFFFVEVVFARAAVGCVCKGVSGTTATMTG